MNQGIADYVRGKAKVIAVSNAYELAPWADALVSSDAAWWKTYREALDFQGMKFGAMPDWQKPDGVEVLRMPSGSNSGLLALKVAEKMRAKKVLLCGFDMHGSHYFGSHKAGLKNPTDARFREFINQFKRYSPKGIEIINCTKGSELDCFPFSDLEKELC